MVWFIEEEVVNNKTWGGRFKKTLDPRAVKFNASLSFDHVLYPYDILGSQVHVKMLARQGLITKEEAEVICHALNEIASEMKEGKHALDESSEDIHMFLEQLLIKKVGEVGKKLHTGRSRNDQVALDLRLYSRDSALLVKRYLLDLCKILRTLYKKHLNDTMPGYTHLQQAQPITLGKYFEAYLSMFQRDLDRLHDWEKRMNVCPLGAGALAGSALPLDREYVAKELKFNGIIKNTIDAVSDRDYVIEFCSIASIMIMHLSRLSEDLILWATSEFNFITLDDAFSTGSSLMPNKKNPDIAELIRGKTGRIFGHLFSLLTIMKALPLAYNKDMQEDKEALFDTVNTLLACLEIITPFLRSLTFNIHVMSRAAKTGYLDATFFLESLVLQGVPFREAHHQVGKWVVEAMSRGCSLKELVKSQEKRVFDAE